MQPAVALEVKNSVARCATKDAYLSTVGRPPSGIKATLEVSDCVAALAEGQREVARNPSISSRKAAFDFAPVMRPTTSPPSNTMSVGIDMTPNF